jgi:hypothetical protein
MEWSPESRRRTRPRGAVQVEAVAVEGRGLWPCSWFCDPPAMRMDGAVSSLVKEVLKKCKRLY